VGGKGRQVKARGNEFSKGKKRFPEKKDWKWQKRGTRKKSFPEKGKGPAFPLNEQRRKEVFHRRGGESSYGESAEVKKRVSLVAKGKFRERKTTAGENLIRNHRGGVKSFFENKKGFVPRGGRPLRR